MADTVNRQVLLASRPDGAPTADNFRLAEAPVPEPGAGEVLYRAIYLSLDPYMRGRMSAAKSYADPLAIGGVMGGGSVGRVVRSNAPGLAEGDYVLGYGGWQDYAAGKGRSLRKLDPRAAPISTALGVLGMPGMTAYTGLLNIGRPADGETLVVASASGPVGGTVGQIGRIKGCRVVGLAGSDEKCAFVKDALGFDDCLNHRRGDLAEALGAACPDGIDVYFENVGGHVFDAVYPLLKPFARIPVCGVISRYNASGLPPGPRPASRLPHRRSGQAAHPARLHRHRFPGPARRLPARHERMGEGRPRALQGRHRGRHRERARGDDRPTPGPKLRQAARPRLARPHALTAPRGCAINSHGRRRGILGSLAHGPPTGDGESVTERSTTGIFETGLDRGPANHQPLTPLSFLAWSAHVYPDKCAVIHGDLRYSYAQFYERCRRLAGALRGRGIGPGDTVAVMAPNVPAMLEAHYGVPMAGAVLNALNYRLDAGTIAFILGHGEAGALITDREFSPTIADALERLGRDILVIDIDDPLAEGGALLSETDYEALLAEGDPEFAWKPPADEWRAISLNYTSGTTGNPKGVVYHHRGAFQNAMGNAMMFGLGRQSVYLWTLPMFHCNGWTYTWAVTAAGGTHVCLRKPDPALIYPMIADHGITHMCGAPIVLNMLVHAPEDQKRRFDWTVEVATGGAAPPSAVIAAMERDGLPRHPPLRPYRDLRAGRRLRLARRMGGDGRGRPRREAGAPGGALSDAQRAHGRRSPDHGAGARRRRDHR